MVKIIFSNGESVEWYKGNLPDEMHLNFENDSQEPVPDRISADHIESLCTMLNWTLSQLLNRDPAAMPPEQQNRYINSIYFARQRALWLREGKG